ncbi:MAG: hypothetical protein H0U65_09725 [Rubrobacter sp.]|nr:hypothetical protein [Rubrobacter sp.]
MNRPATRCERVGIADGYAQGGGGAALANLHTSPGLGNAIVVVVTAFHNKTPLVITRTTRQMSPLLRTSPLRQTRRTGSPTREVEP